MARPKRKRVNLGPSLESTVKEIEHAIVVERLKASRRLNDRLCAVIVMVGIAFCLAAFGWISTTEKLVVCQSNTATVVQ